MTDADVNTGSFQVSGFGFIAHQGNDLVGSSAFQELLNDGFTELSSCSGD